MALENKEKKQIFGSFKDELDKLKWQIEKKGNGIKTSVDIEETSKSLANWLKPLFNNVLLTKKLTSTEKVQFQNIVSKLEQWKVNNEDLENLWKILIELEW